MADAMITWYGHSCFRVELAGSTVVLDPYGAHTVPGLRLPELKADAVHASHSHSDHNGVDHVERSGKALNFTLRTVAGCHDAQQGACRGGNAIAVIEGDGLRIVHMGDQGCLLTEEQVAQIGKADVLMVPVGGYCTVDAIQANVIAKQLDAAVVVPMHYRHGVVGYDVLAEVEPFLTGDKPVLHCEDNSFAVKAGMEPCILIPKVVQ